MALFLVVFLLVGLEKTENIYVRPITIASGNESSKSILCSFSITTQRVSQQIMPTTNFILNIRETNSVRVFTNPAYDAQRRTTSGLYKLKYTFVLSPKNNPKNRPAHNSQKIDQIRPFKNCAFVVQFCWNHSQMKERPDYSKIGANKTRKTYNKTQCSTTIYPLLLIRRHQNLLPALVEGQLDSHTQEQPLTINEMTACLKNDWWLRSISKVNLCDI